MHCQRKIQKKKKKNREKDCNSKTKTTDRRLSKKRRVATRRRKRETGGLLNHYEFTYAGRGIVNEAAKTTPGVIKNASNEINNVAKQRIDQLISQGGKELSKYFPKFLEEPLKISIRHHLDYLEILESNN